jgi:hypothetical protein
MISKFLYSVCFLCFSLSTFSEELSLESLYQHVDPSLLKSDHDDLKEAFKNRVISPSAWQSKMNDSSWDVLCLGETHNQQTREAISTNILNNLNIDHLMLETQAESVDPLLQEYRQVGSVQLLGAPLTDVLNTVYESNPDVKISGVERSQKQAFLVTQESIKFQRGKLSREAFIAQNIIDRFVKGEKTLALYGALHCSNLNEGLGFNTPFYQLMAPFYQSQDLKTLNIKIIRAQDHHVLSAYLRQYGYFNREPIILTDLQSFDPQFYNYQIDLYKLFKAFDTVVLIP